MAGGQEEEQRADLLMQRRSSSMQGVRQRQLIGCGGNPEGTRPRENPILIRNFSKTKKKQKT